MAERRYVQADFTKEFAQKLIDQYGTVDRAARKIQPFCWSHRYKRPVAWRTIREWINQHGSVRASLIRGDGKELLAPATPEAINRIAELLSKANIPIEAIGSISNVKLKSWGAGAKIRVPLLKDGKEQFDKRGRLITKDEFVKDGLWATNITLDPVWKEGPKWPVIQRAAQAPIKYVVHAQKGDPKMRRVLIIGDAQGGFWLLPKGGLEPFHDERAIEAVLALIAHYQPTEVVLIGDLIDAAEFSRYLQLPEFQRTFQPSIDWAYALLCRLRSIVGPKAKITWLEGNHERRVPEMIVKNAVAAHGIRQADMPDSWPVMSIPHLCRLDELGVEYVNGYPSSQHWITPKLVCQHQDPVKTDLRASIIHGHQEEIKVSARTIHYQDGHEVFFTYCVPGVTRIEQTNLDRDRLIRTPVPSARARRNVQQAVATVDVFEDDFFAVNVIPIQRGRLLYQGHVFGKRAA